MYRNNKFRKGFGKRKGKKMSPTKKAFIAGLKAGKRMARNSRSKRWY